MGKSFYALIVGVDNYKDEEFKNLTGAVRDAEKLAEFFRDRLTTKGGYSKDQVHIVLLKNPKSPEVREKLEDIVKNCLDDDSVFVFYFAGHGLCLPRSDRPSLLCYDAGDALLRGVVSAGEISPDLLLDFSRHGRGSMAFILDACRTNVFSDEGRGGFQRQRGITDFGRDVTNRAEREPDSGGRCLMSSCRDGQRASDNGDYVNSLIEEWDESLSEGRGMAVGFWFSEGVKGRLKSRRLRQRPEFQGDSFALTPGAFVGSGEGRGDSGDGVVVVLDGGRSSWSKLAGFATFGVFSGIVLLGVVWLLNAGARSEPERQTPPQRVEPAQGRPSGSGSGSELSAEPSLGAGGVPSGEVGASERGAAGVGDESAESEVAKCSRCDKASVYSVVETVGGEARELRFCEEHSSEYHAARANELAEEGARLFADGKLDEAMEKVVEASRWQTDSPAAAALKGKIVAKWNAEAGEALDAKDYSKAKTLAEKTLEFEPADADALKIKEDADAGIVRAAEASALFAKATEALEKNDYESALKELEKVFTFDAQNEEALELTKRAKELKERAERAAEVAALVKDGWSALNSGDFARATTLAEEAQSKDSENRGAKELLAAVQKGRAKASAEEGGRLFADGKLDEAAKKVVEALGLDPKCREATDLQAKIRTSRLDAAEVALNAKDYSKAKTLAEKVLALAQNDGRASFILWRANAGIEGERKVATILEEGETAFKESRFEEAREKAREALALEPENELAKDLASRAEKAVKDAEVAKDVNDGWTALRARDFEKALKLAGGAATKAPESKSAKELLDAVKKEYAESLAKEGERKLILGDRDAALAKANEALALDPNCAAAKALKEAFDARTTTKGDWSESATRPAGTRQALRIGATEYWFVWIPKGTFNMGSNDEERGRSSDETLHTVELTRGFWMLESEVVQALYKETTGTNPSVFNDLALPVENVSYHDAVAFCEALEKKLPKELNLKVALPTEAQWERAALETGEDFRFGGDGHLDDAGLREKCNYVGAGLRKTTPPKTYPANRLGLYDMIGNVREWVLDRYGDYASAGVVVDPQGPNDGAQRVCRGGSFRSSVMNCRPAFRFAMKPEEADSDVGFRIVVVVGD